MPLKSKNLEDACITPGKIQDSAVQTEKLAPSAATTPKIRDHSISESKLLDSCVTTNKIRNNSILRDKIVNDEVTLEKLAEEVRRGLLTGKRLPRYRPGARLTITPPSTTWNVTDEMEGKVPGGNEDISGVITDPPDNLVYLKQVNGDDVLVESTYLSVTEIGGKIFGRITYSSGVWTLTFYTLNETTGNENRVPVSGIIRWFYPQSYTIDLLPFIDSMLSLPFDAVAARLVDRQIKTRFLDDRAVTLDKLADFAFGEDKILDGAITTDKIRDGAVTLAKLVGLLIDSDHLGNNAVTSGKILDGAVTSGKILDGAVTANKILDGVITLAKLASGFLIDSDHLANDSVTESKIATGAITSGRIGNIIANTNIIALAGINESKLDDLGKEGTTSLLENMRRRFRESFIEDYVESGYETTAMVIPRMSVRVALGVAYPYGARIQNLIPNDLDIDDAGVLLNRIDIVQLNKNGELSINKGILGLSPAEPDPDINCIKLSAISVPSGTVVINSGNITDRRKLYSVDYNRVSLRHGRNKLTTGGGVLTFDLSYTPLTDSEMVFKNGLLQEKDVIYSVSGNHIIFFLAPLVSDNVEVRYQYER